MDNGESSKVTIQGIPQKLNSGGTTKNEQQAPVMFLPKDDEVMNKQVIEGMEKPIFPQLFSDFIKLVSIF